MEKKITVDELSTIIAICTELSADAYGQDVIDFDMATDMINKLINGKQRRQKSR